MNTTDAELMPPPASRDERTPLTILEMPAGAVFATVLWEGPTPNVEEETAADVLACLF